VTLPVSPPGTLGLLEVESALLAEKSDEFEATPRMDDLMKGGVDGSSQGMRTKDLGRLMQDISIYVDRCLSHM